MMQYQGTQYYTHVETCQAPEDDRIKSKPKKEGIFWLNLRLIISFTNISIPFFLYLFPFPIYHYNSLVKPNIAQQCSDNEHTGLAPAVQQLTRRQFLCPHFGSAQLGEQYGRNHVEGTRSESEQSTGEHQKLIWEWSKIKWSQFNHAHEIENNK